MFGSILNYYASLRLLQTEEDSKVHLHGVLFFRNEKNFEKLRIKVEKWTYLLYNEVEIDDIEVVLSFVYCQENDTMAESI